MQIIAARRDIGVDIALKEIRPIPVGGKQDIVAFPLVSIHPAGEDRRFQRLVLQRDIQDVVVIGNFNVILIFFLGRLAGLRVCVRRCPGAGFGAIPGLDFLLQRQLILLVKESLQRRLYFRPCIVLIHDRQVRSQNVRIVVDFVQVVAVLVIAGMRGFDIVNLAPQRILHSGIVAVGTPDILVLCRIRASQQRPPRTADHRRAG